MAMLRFCFYLLVMLLFIVMGLVFSFRNQSLINVDFIFYQFPPLSSGLWVLSAFICGVVLGGVLVYPKSIFQGIKLKRMSKKVAEKNTLPTQAKTESNICR